MSRRGILALMAVGVVVYQLSNSSFSQTACVSQQAKIEELQALLSRQQNKTLPASAPVVNPFWKKEDKIDYPEPNSPFAYVFVIGGCSPEDPGSYRGYIYNAMIASKLLKERGSTADIVVWIQISYKSSADSLPQNQENWLSQQGIQVRYLPKNPLESFIDIIMEKFRILGMTEYQKVLFLDSDIMPLGNLDYFFDLSTKGILKDQILLTSRSVPMCAGFFLVTPQEGDYELAKEMIHQKFLDAFERQILTDPYKGWGHPIDGDDYWENGSGERYQNWTWYGADVDQGFGYHWPKYVKKNLTIILRNDYLENWGTTSSEDEMVVLEQTFNNTFENYSNPILDDPGACRKYLCDHVHFDARNKPWKKGPPNKIDYSNRDNRLLSSMHLWFHTLHELDDEMNMNINFTHWQEDSVITLSRNWKLGLTQRNMKAGLLELQRQRAAAKTSTK